jgi:hypothetical protein
MKFGKKSPQSSQNLVNDLTIEEARHLIGNEGGPLAWDELAVRLGTELVVAGALAYAIWQGNVTVWHLALPSLAQYMTLLLAMPLIYVVLRHPGLRKDSMGAVRLLIFIVAVVAIVTAVRAREHQTPWRAQFVSDAELLWNWIVDANVHWPIAVAAAGVLFALPGRIRSLYKYGPPFMGVSLGCAMRLVVLFLGAFLLRVVLSHSTRAVWFLWAVLLLAEVLALAMHWDVQRRLQRIDGSVKSQR